MSSAQDKIWFGKQLPSLQPDCISDQLYAVTGTSAGLGLSMVVYLLDQGNKVVATMRNTNALSNLAQKYSSDQLLVLKLDVASASEIINPREGTSSRF